MAVVSKKSIISLYAYNNDMYSHRVRLTLAEKGIPAEIIDISALENPEDIEDLNPYNNGNPALVDRDLVLHEPRIIMEYLDERFPHPPLMPVYPKQRAEYRLMMHCIDKDWGNLAYQIEKGDDKKALKKAQTFLVDDIAKLSPILKNRDYFYGGDFTLVDCYMATLLWRLPALGIQDNPLPKYAERLFARPAFQESLTESEREIRSPVAL